MKYKKREIIVSEDKVNLQWLPRVTEQDVNLHQDFSTVSLYRRLI